MLQVIYQLYLHVQITDLHYGEALDLDNNSTRLVESIIEHESPDFLVFTGDMVAGIFWMKT